MRSRAPIQRRALAIGSGMDGEDDRSNMDAEDGPLDATLPDMEAMKTHAPTVAAFMHAVYGEGGAGPSGKAAAGSKRKAEVRAWGTKRQRAYGQWGPEAWPLASASAVLWLW